MIDHKSSFITSSATIREAMLTIEQSEGKIAIVVDDDEKLIGTITDGDIRRALIDGLSSEDPAESAAFKSPTTAHINELGHKKELLNRMQELQIRQIPIIDDDRRVVGLETTVHLRLEEKKDNWIVLMAGGEGQRLRPLTEDTPKPMLNIGSKPILETTVQNFVESGFDQFFISVNYKADVIKDHFKDGSDFGAQIEYLQEDQPLDTAGALKLLKDAPKKPFIVMNGDILTKVDFSNVLNFHNSHNALATMCVREYSIQVPYGVVNSDEFEFQSVEEKPSFSYFVNAGIYVFDPKVLEFIKPDTPLSMTDLFQNLKESGETCCTYPIHEYWLDIGKIDDYNRALTDFANIF